MNKISHLFIGVILLLSFSSEIFGVNVFLNQKKEPKIFLSEPVKIETTQTETTTPQKKEEIIIKEPQKSETITPKEEVKFEEKKIEPIVKIEDKSNIEVEVLEAAKKQKETIDTLKKEKNEIIPDKPLHIDEKQTKKNLKSETIALVFASNTIGKYSIEATNVALTHLINSNQKFQLDVFDIEIETKQNITTILDSLREKEIKKVILLLTSNSMWALNSYPEISKFDIYLPLVNIANVTNPKSNYIFGGMDYKKQFQFFVSKASSNIVEIYDESGISKSLHEELVALNIPNLKSVQLVGKNPNYNPLFSRANKIKNSTVILNTSIVKSAIVLALLRGNSVVPKEVFATQLNYSSLIFNLTQWEDRDNLFVANSIELLPRDLEELLSFFGDDILFNWVNYSTILGLEYFMTNNKKLFKNIEIKGNQVNYPVKLFGFEGTKFVETK
ncbi:MAG: hypothetical protein PHF17_07900 [Arcobacteraceae bacterium]|nr:hypothetical protein [Arcobacteraceae bacterium]